MTSDLIRNGYPMTSQLVFLMAMAAGLSIIGNYYVQPLMQAVADVFGLSKAQAGALVTVSQTGYTLGLFFLVPLADILESRKTVTVLMLMTLSGVLLMGGAPSVGVFVVGSALAGTCSVTAQIFVALSVALSAPEVRGRIMGIVFSGLLTGMIIARTVAGGIGQLGGWRMPYFVSGIVMAVVIFLLWKQLPVRFPQARASYGALLLSTIRLFRHRSFLRLAGMGFFIFGHFSILWTSLTFLLVGPAYGYAESVVGLFGLAGAAGIWAARFAGRMVDRGWTARLIQCGGVLLCIAWMLLLLGGNSLFCLLAGIVALDFAMQGIQIANQSILFMMAPEARNRLNSGYMTAYFSGGVLMSLLSALSFEKYGWDGVCMIGLFWGFAAVGFTLLFMKPEKLCGERMHIDV
ncbi:MAG: MFS transporter [Desulfovibrionaceae bacterium]|nr:MFS transporter [Desulfovibrionaceae bacterium]